MAGGTDTLRFTVNVQPLNFYGPGFSDLLFAFGGMKSATATVTDIQFEKSSCAQCQQGRISWNPPRSRIFSSSTLFQANPSGYQKSWFDGYGQLTFKSGPADKLKAISPFPTGLEALVGALTQNPFANTTAREHLI